MKVNIKYSFQTSYRYEQDIQKSDGPRQKGVGDES